MELPKRPRGEEFARPGLYRELEAQVRNRAEKLDISIAYFYAFDYRTRMLPFMFFDKALIPGSAMAIGAALRSAGFENTRLILQQWSPNIRPSQVGLGGKPPEILFVSSMQINSAAAYELVRDAWTLGANRPLILAGGAKAIYEPWDYFALSEDGEVGADCVCTGEELVFIELLDRVLEHKAASETMLQAFDRTRREGLLEDIPGLVFRGDRGDGPPALLVNTGPQRLVRDLDEPPSVALAMDLFEGRNRKRTVSPRPVLAERLRRHAGAFPLVITKGCKFRCSYCPIPGFNQFTFRMKSPERLIEEIKQLSDRTGIYRFFSTDDNFFNSRQVLEKLLPALASADLGGRFGDHLGWATEGTEFDILKNRDLIPLAREAKLRMIWFGLEDMTAELVRKGQTPEKTDDLMRLLIANHIGPMPMLIHHDGQPLWSSSGLYGIINQVRTLRRLGALSMQVSYLMPSVGTKSVEQLHEKGMVMKQVGAQQVEDRRFDGNHCVASNEKSPWRKQLNVLLSYGYFYNPFNLIRDLFRRDKFWHDRVLLQMIGNLSFWGSLKNHLSWIIRLARGPIVKAKEVPRPKLPMIHPESSQEVAWTTEA